MKHYRIFPEETSFYYSTCTIVEWLNVFQDETYFNIILESLNFCRKQKGLYLLGYIIMPSHLHLITSNRTETTLSDIMRDFKAYTSRNIREQLEKDKRNNYLRILEYSAKNLPKQQYRLWMDDYHPIALSSEKWFNQKLSHMHNNPVRKGFVVLPEHWKYSSARNWLLNDERIMTLDWQVLSLEG